MKVVLLRFFIVSQHDRLLVWEGDLGRSNHTAHRCEAQTIQKNLSNNSLQLQKEQ